MREWLFLIPFLPGVGSILLGIFGRSLPRRAIAWIAVGSVGISFLVAAWLGAEFHSAFSQRLWTWMRVGDFHPEISLRLDALSLVMTLVVTLVGFLIHLYSIEFMIEEEGYSRFFAYMNLFVASMLTLVLADDLLLLYLGWEGVGLCSYLLIGFWYQDPANGRAARKAFLVTRIGDTSMAVGLFLLFLNLRTLEIQPLLQRAAAQWTPGSSLATAAAALLLGGAVGKSAQLPLQVWLPDAMAGPTPVSALIHAATMVTAGVYLIARTHTLFELAPSIQATVAIIGAASLLISAFSALTQTDIKRILAYSTMSQVGYMFLGLGVGAWGGAIFHFMTHAFFKALLFLGAGAVIQALHHEHDIFRMGGLRQRLPVVFWTFLIGAASLSALPFVTSGYYSKEMILVASLASPFGSPWLWAVGILGAFLTSVYSFRLVFVVFFGQPVTPIGHRPGVLILAPLVVLAAFSLFAGLLGGKFSSHGGEGFGGSAFVASLASVLGIATAYLLYLGAPERLASFTARVPRLRRFFFYGWGFDDFYDHVFVQPFLFLTAISRGDVMDRIFDGIAQGSLWVNHLLALAQNGKVRWYAAVIGAGAAVLLVIAEVR